MADSQKARSKPRQKSQASGFNFSSGNFEEMFKMMQNFCADGEGSYKCCIMMQKMCGSTPKEPKK